MTRHRVITSKPIPVKLDDELLKRVERMSQQMGEAKSTVMRIAMRLGMDGLEKTFAEPPKPKANSNRLGDAPGADVDVEEGKFGGKKKTPPEK
jgi:hypothetical protein